MFDKSIVFDNLTRTAQEAADQIGCNVAQIAKSIIFKTEDDMPILVVASGINRIDISKVEKIIGKKIGKADADYVLAKTGYVIGGVPPYNHQEKIQTLIDEDLMQHKEIWASAGKSNSVFKLTPQDLVNKTKGKIIVSKPN